MYPEVLREDQQTAIEYIKEVACSYLYKDILAFNRLKNPETLERLLQALALQVGSEVSYNERFRIPKAFTDAYPGVSVSVVSKTSYWDFITPSPDA